MWGAGDPLRSTNDGKSGTAVKQTTLGFVGPPGFGQNRGCMSQWGARCLESQGNDYLGILRHYYGSDIGITTAPGSCGLPTQPSGAQPSGPSCGDGACNGGEDCNTCAQDCGACPSTNPDPGPQPSGGGGECASSCGGQAPSGCWCDNSCAGYGDCCSDGSTCSACGNCGSTQEPEPTAGTCSATGHQGSGENGESCSDPAETWRCVWISSWSAWGSQVCRYGVWTTYNLNPTNCAACCGDYDSGCSA